MLLTGRNPGVFIFEEPVPDNNERYVHAPWYVFRLQPDAFDTPVTVFRLFTIKTIYPSYIFIPAVTPPDSSRFSAAQAR